jgi:hypothetical protein
MIEVGSVTLLERHVPGARTGTVAGPVTGRSRARAGACVGRGNNCDLIWFPVSRIAARLWDMESESAGPSSKSNMPVPPAAGGSARRRAAGGPLTDVRYSSLNLNFRVFGSTGPIQVTIHSTITHNYWFQVWILTLTTELNDPPAVGLPPVTVPG